MIEQVTVFLKHFLVNIVIFLLRQIELENVTAAGKLTSMPFGHGDNGMLCHSFESLEGSNLLAPPPSPIFVCLSYKSKRRDKRRGQFHKMFSSGFIFLV